MEWYWSRHTVNSRPFKSAGESEAYLAWRFQQYPLFREFMDLWGDHDGQTILDYGCGPGDDVTGFLLHTGARRVIGLDVSPKALDLTHRRLQLHEIDPGRYDLIKVSDATPSIPLETASSRLHQLRRCPPSHVGAQSASSPSSRVLSGRRARRVKVFVPERPALRVTPTRSTSRTLDRFGTFCDRVSPRQGRQVKAAHRPAIGSTSLASVCLPRGRAALMAGSGAYRVLVLYVTPDPRFERLTTLHHLDALTGLDGPVEVLSFNAVRGAPGWLRRLRFDAVVLHTTLLCQRWTPTFETWKRGIEWLADLPAVKIAFPQDEYDFAHVLDEWLDELGVSVVCTVLDDRHRSELYPRLSGRASFYEVLTGYIDEDSAQDLRRRIVPSSERTPDLVYRATKLPYWYGSHGQSKHLIGRAAVARASRHGLSYDISTRPGDMILGDAWLDFLAAGRATIGTESGSSVLDPRGEIQARVRGLLAENPGLSFDQLSHQMPAGWDDYRFFAISPRHLEAIATKTAQILVRGRYSGVLEADRHYIPVEPDFSNLDDALEQLRDPGLAEQIAEQAYEDVYQSGLRSSRQLTETLNGIIHEHAPTASAGQGIAFTIGAPIARNRSGGIELGSLSSFGPDGAALLC